MTDGSQSTYRWYLLALAAATHTFAAAIPFSCMPVLFKEISDDLGLGLVQIGTIWGMASLAGVFVSLIGGLLGDRFGVKRTLGFACFLMAVTGALRGLSGSFATLAATIFVYGLIRGIIPVNVHKTVNIWFHGKNLGTANGVVAMGMGIGLMLGPMISATWLSPLLGGWRNVLFLYGTVSLVISILWFLFGKEPQGVGYSAEVPIAQALSRLVRIKHLWLPGLTLLFRAGCILGMVGYLPLYLREQGWVAATADGTLAVFFAISTVAVIPLSLLSDRIGSRKAILFPALLTTLAGLGLLSVANGVFVWILIILVGIFMDGFMAIILTMVQETEGVGPRYSGTALGLVFTISQLGGFASPPIGNSLASVNPGLPFIFWASLSAASLVTLAFVKETGHRKAGTIHGLPDTYPRA